MRQAAFLIFLAAACAASAAPLERDLGRGLAYRRVHRMPADLIEASPPGNHPCVLDIRFVKGDSADATVLLGWLRAHAGPKTPVILLANASTGRRLLETLDSPDSVNGLVIIGPAAPDFVPDIALTVNAYADRRAYDALEKGATIESLTVEKIVKARVDEDKLDREHLPDSTLPDDVAPADPTAPDESQSAGPPIDAVLSRAIQLHRSLLALKRLP
jgi:hypothetical protein